MRWREIESKILTGVGSVSVFIGFVCVCIQKEMIYYRVLEILLDYLK